MTCALPTQISVRYLRNTHATARFVANFGGMVRTHMLANLNPELAGCRHARPYPSTCEQCARGAARLCGRRRRLLYNFRLTAIPLRDRKRC